MKLHEWLGPTRNNCAKIHSQKMDQLKMPSEENDSEGSKATRNAAHRYGGFTANMQAYQAKLLEIAQANVQFAFDLGLRLGTIRSPAEFFAVITEFTHRRVDMFWHHSKELAAYPFLRIKPPRELTALPGG
ncbi:phasin family protein [Bradyrhizobium liaoningense]|uniref:phasin family protein n=1 Tax=Bradyrhizobium liaoningense TaxID=43992 RepID=UPI0020114178|nr:phasin family protein [Bradyrhizobium liaoningense]